MRNIGLRITDHGHHPAEDGAIGPEKINKGSGEDKDQSA